ncbi:MAG: AraC family transcriptional regulator [Spirochaetes bacterium]|nr:MAG: AraC family transcriptional regulator [Spirochaetota bacterium]
MNWYEAINFFAVATAVLASAGLLVRRPSFRSIMLALFLLFCGYAHLLIFLFESGRFVDYPLVAALYFTHIPPGLAAGPLLYFHARSMAGDAHGLSRRDWAHFLPALASAILLADRFTWSAREKIAFVEDFLRGGHAAYRYALLALMLYVLAYTVAAFFTIMRRLRPGNPVHARIAVLEFSILGIALIVIINGLALFFPYPAFTMFENLATSAGLAVIFLLIQRYPHIFRYADLSSGDSPPRTYLAGVDTGVLRAQLVALMEDEKFYCDEDLSLKRLADALEVTPHQLSEFLNDRFGKNFSTFVNGYRILESQRILLEEPARSTLSVAYAAGFNSYTSFYNAFRKSTGMSPGEYRKRNRRP